MRKKTIDLSNCLKADIRVPVRFSEVDSMAIVWHGNYIHFFEDAREAFGKKYGIGYMDIYSNGFVAPIVSLNCEYKKPLKYGDEALVEIYFINSPAAKIIFSYKIFNAETKDLIATGESTQVFVATSNNELYLSHPSFFENWKKDNGLM